QSPPFRFHFPLTPMFLVVPRSAQPATFQAVRYPGRSSATACHSERSVRNTRRRPERSVRSTPCHPERSVRSTRSRRTKDEGRRRGAPHYSTRMRVGIYVFAVASIAAGVINLIWHDFALGWQPITAFGDAVPGRELLAIVTATWLVIAGLALLWRRSAAGGAIALGVVYAVFAIFWLPRLYWIVRLYGFSPAHLIGVIDGFCQQAILVCAAIIVWAHFSEASSR